LRPGIVEISRDKSVGAESGASNAVESLLEEIRRGYALCEGDGLVAQLGLSVDEDGFIDQVPTEEGAIEVRTAFEKETDDVALGECREDCRKAEAAGVIGDKFNFGAASFESSDLFLGCGASAEDEEIVLGGENELRGEWSAEVGIEHDAEQKAPARLGSVASIGEERVVGEDGANACEDGI
jgi:hypothetical protein